MATTHQLKIDPKYYLDVYEGRKRAEIRLNDRDYKQGDFLNLRAWDNKTGYHDVAPLCCIVTHVLKYSPLLPPTHVMLSIAPLNNNEI